MKKMKTTHQSLRSSNHRGIVTYCSSIVSSLLVTLANAGTVQMDDYWKTSDGPAALRNAFFNAQNAAGNNGVIQFSSNKYASTKILEINKTGLTLVGNGKTATTIELDTSTFTSTKKTHTALLLVNANGVTVEDMTIQGPWIPETSGTGHNLGAGGDVILEKGLVAAASIRANRKDFTATNVRFRYAYTALGADYGYPFDGGRLINCETTASVNGALWRDDGPGLLRQISNKFIVDNCSFNRLNEPGVRLNGVRGFSHDFGNTTSSYTIVDLKNSELKNSDSNRVMKWNFDLNRVRKVKIWNNVLNGGGAGGNPDFVNNLHFEDKVMDIEIGHATDASKGNELYNQSLLPSSSYIWMQAPDATTPNNPPFGIHVRNNVFDGPVQYAISYRGGATGSSIQHNEFNVDINASGFNKIFVANPPADGSSNGIWFGGGNKLNGSTMNSEDIAEHVKID